MQKRGIAATTLYAITTIEFSLKNQKQDIVLANIETLTQTEFGYNNGAERRVMDSFQSEPVYQVDVNGNKTIETIFVYTETSCYGSGIIACEYDFSADISQRPL